MLDRSRQHLSILLSMLGTVNTQLFVVNWRPRHFLWIQRLLFQNWSDGIRVIAMKQWSKLISFCWLAQLQYEWRGGHQCVTELVRHPLLTQLIYWLERSYKPCQYEKVGDPACWKNSTKPWNFRKGNVPGELEWRHEWEVCCHIGFLPLWHWKIILPYDFWRDKQSCYLGSAEMTNWEDAHVAIVFALNPFSFPNTLIHVDSKCRLGGCEFTASLPSLSQRRTR